ncbi:MAG: ABC transporter permease [Spirochaetia bacterium]|jgi:ribose transport system permease protein
MQRALESTRQTLGSRVERTRLLEKSAIYIVLGLVFLIAAIVSPVFLMERNLSNVIRQAAILGVVATGQTFVILAGGIDLSVASVIAFMSILSANLMAGKNEMVLPIAALCLGISLLIGLMNGLLVTRLNIPPFIATLGMGLVVQGARFIYCNGVPKGSIPNDLRFFGRSLVLGVPVPVILCIGGAIIAWVLLRRTTFGRGVYATGGNARTAFLSGVPVKAVRTATYVLSSLWAGIAGLILTGYIGFADNWLGRGYDLNSIAAVVIGGTALSGGKGGIWGTLAGALMIWIMFNVVLLLGLDIDAQRIVKGVVIILAVSLYARLNRRD